jgi:hypothetical protein
MTTQQLKTIEHGQDVAQVAQIMTPMQMVYHAVTNGSPVEVVEKLMGLQERWQANQARMAFDNAMADAKAEIPVIVKRSNVKYDVKNKDANGNVGANNARADKVDFDYETLGDIATVINPILSKSGLSYRYRSKQESGLISVTCIITHRDGHCEETTLAAGADTSGKKNSIQSIGSTVSYLQRYTLKLALGLAAAKDDDGKAAADPDERISEKQLTELMELSEKLGVDKIKFCKWAEIEAFSEIRSADFHKAKNAILARGKQAAKKEQADGDH